MTTLRAVVAVAAISLAATAAHARELPPLLERALQQGEVANQIRWSFTSSFENDDVSLLFRYEPRGEAGNFTLLAPDALDDTGTRVFARISEDDDADSDLTHEQARVVIGDQEVRVVEETDEYVTYAVRPNPWDDVEEDQAAVFEHLMAELTVSKTLEQITQLRLYNHEPFHARLVARVDRFEQIMRFEPEPTTGLPLMTSLRQEVEGSAFFRRLIRIREETYRDFNPVGLEGGEASCAATCLQEFLAAQ